MAERHPELAYALAVQTTNNLASMALNKSCPLHSTKEKLHPETKAEGDTVIVNFPDGFFSRHLVCHFTYWDGPITGLMCINGRHWFCERMYGSPSRYRLTPIRTTGDVVRYLERYRRHWPHCFYLNGVRPHYDGGPLVPMGVNPIAEQAGKSQ